MGETGELRGPRVEVAGRHEQADVEPRSKFLDRSQVDVREPDIGRRELSRQRVLPSYVDDNGICIGIPSCRLDGGGITIDGDDGAETQLRCCD